MPEFLTEKNYIRDFIENKDWIFGLLGEKKDAEFEKCIRQLFTFAYENGKIQYNSLHFVSNKEAEMIKLFKNCFLATKVSFCNEMYDFCRIKGINYEQVRILATKDERILPSHTRVPGPDGQRGFGGTCFPKDTSSLRYEMIASGMEPFIMNSIIERNEKVDRPQKDWTLNKGRAIVE
jgi:UDPglucose 6-dehydrogenase